MYVRKQGVFIDSGALRARGATAHDAILKMFTLTYLPEFSLAVPITLRNYQVVQANNKTFYIFPRGAHTLIAEALARVAPTAPALARKYEDGYEPLAALGRVSIPASTLRPLLDEQCIIVRHIIGLLCTNGTACLNLRAGFGKTFIALALANALAPALTARGGRKDILYIVPRCELANQVCRDALAYGELYAASASSQHTCTCVCLRADGSKALRALMSAREPASAGARIIVTVINSALRALSTPTDANASAFAMTIFDEVHSYCSAQRAKIFALAGAPIMFGMSATTDERRDSFDEMFKQHLHPLVRAENVPGFSYEGASFKCSVRAISYFGPSEYSQDLCHEATEKIFVHYMYEQFAADAERNALILRELRDLLLRGHNVFVMAEERGALEHLQKLYASASALIYGGTPKNEFDDAAKNARVIFTTYSYAGTGISIPRMTALILASPRYAQMVQIVGRILRKGSDPTKERVVVDIIDANTCLAKQFAKRTLAYKVYNCEMITSQHRAGDAR